MRVFSKIVVGIIIVTAGAVLAVMTSDRLQERLVSRALHQSIMHQQTQSALFGGDNLDVVFCGTASPMGNADRAQQCIAVLAGDQFFIVDSGARSTANVVAASLPVGRLNGVLLTHFHSDHISSLGELHLASWVRGRDGPLAVYGGAGVSQVVDGFNLAYGLDYGYRTAHHGEEFVPSKNAGLVAREFALSDREMTVIHDAGGLVISAFAVPHEPVSPALGYRFDYGGRSIVMSGDTSASEMVQRAADGADVLIHEVLQPNLVRILSMTLRETGQDKLGQIIDDTLDYHTFPQDAAKIAQAAGADMLVFTHFAPPPASRLVERFYTRDIDKDFIQPVLAEDGLWLRLPVGSDDIEMENLID